MCNPMKSSILLGAFVCLAVSVPVAAQQPFGHEDEIAQPTPAPLPRREQPTTDEVPLYKGILTVNEAPWGLTPEMLEPLFEKAAVYGDYTSRFTCNEDARLADYDSTGKVQSENLREYGYLLTKDVENRLQEYRQRMSKDGTLRPGEVRDAETFPPAYAWVFLFSRFNEPSFSYRLIADRFDGFDWVYEIEFRGSHRFTDGQDIRQWEGVALVNAVTFAPIEIRAEPVGQRERIEARYEAYNKSFNVMGMRTAPKPLGYRAEVHFRHRKDDLSFPTQVRYDTFRAVGPQQVAMTKASTRVYSQYRIFRATAEPREVTAGGP